MDIALQLRASPFFRHMPEDALARMLPAVLPRRAGKGAAIFQQGDPARGFYVVTAGRVKIRVASSSGKEQVLHYFKAGDSFGEAACLSGSPYPGDAVAMEDCRLLFVDGARFLAELRGDPDFALAVLRSMARRLVEFAGIIENLSIREVKARLACYLVSLRPDGAPGELELPVGKAELARLLGTTAESLSRALRELSDRGAIAVDGRRIRLLAPESLFKLAGQ